MAIHKVRRLLKGSGHRLKCPYCGGVNVGEKDPNSPGYGDMVELYCRSCRTEFSVNSNSIPYRSCQGLPSVWDT